MTDAPTIIRDRDIECLDCGHTWHGDWTVRTTCPECGRGYTLPKPKEEGND